MRYVKRRPACGCRADSDALYGRQWLAFWFLSENLPSLFMKIQQRRGVVILIPKLIHGPNQGLV